ncbi:MAG: SpoVA/SpoVAEb family sporulation membrane protein [Clostridiales bacterium]|jgi:stage V sporulation protein AC|nr:SpoVA/SpoVAEb family sporulation membrane protein [Clostridiales bacterium]
MNNQKLALDNKNYYLEQQKVRYNAFVNSYSPRTDVRKSLLHSFFVGGITCCIAQLVHQSLALFFPTLSNDLVATYTLMIIVFAAIVLTGIGWYDDIGRWGGAGSFLPITGFANAMASSAMEFGTEGIVFGISVKMFNLVGPVVVNGVVWSTVLGAMHYIVVTLWG